MLFAFNSNIVIAKPVKEFRGIWVTTTMNLDYPLKPTTDSSILKAEAISILDNAKSLGFNAIILQVRPSGDAIYKSKIFPWSKYLTKDQGIAPSDSFDPLSFFIYEAHKRGLQLHAWINPYRVTASSYDDITKLAPTNPAILHPDWVVKYTDNKLYFDPGIPQVRQLVLNGVKEIIQNYNVDGIHLDDYFYPGTDFPDSKTFKTYGKNYSNIDNWRRANNDKLIKDIHDLIHKIKPKITFGVSPSGVWANKSKNALGSNTKGQQAYYTLYCDTRGWVKKNYLDYIAPQLYWSVGDSSCDYKTLVNWWSDVVKSTGVKLYIGMAAYKAGNTDPKSPWYGAAEISRQIQLNKTVPSVRGSIMFRYKCFELNPKLSELFKK
jgi:uncharacterized lipoprotein YddW (UPF0748 family)